MNGFGSRFAAVALVAVASTVLSQTADAEEPAGLQFFREQIQPVLKAQCIRCHAGPADKAKGGLDLETHAALLKGGDSGPAIVPGEPAESLIIQALRHEAGLQMPPKSPKLTDRTIAEFVKWVELEAPLPADSTVGSGLAEGRRHWSFQPIRKPTPPAVAQSEWKRNAVDAFVLAKLAERRWQPAPPATRVELIRRLTFDLIGLPPTPAEVSEFIGDDSPEVYEKLVDRLLASPQYGERWGQHWLDVVRFAETEGYEYDRHIPDAWRFRDYVIQSFNSDQPFDAFATQQIAGDELEPESHEGLTASIFHRLGPVRRNAGNPDIALSRNEVLTERTDIIGTAFLGLTVGCARCHNHKFDPIPQRDYYRLQAYFAATAEHNVVLASANERKVWEARMQETKQEIARLKTIEKTKVGTEKDRLTEQIEALEDQLPPPLATIPATHNDTAQRTAMHVLRRGVWENKGEAVGPRPLSVITADTLAELKSDDPRPRAHLARWLVSPDQPLTARVLVNRLWLHHFGTGLVKTPNDFGIKGDRPSHPELLDWLSASLVENGWRLKPLHRLIILSGTYRQSSRAPQAVEYARSDPENRLLWRFNRRRLSAEEYRDTMLAVSGQLNLKIGGPSVIPPVDPDLVKLLYKPVQWSVTADLREHDRRTVYLIAKRNLRLPFLEILDAPALLTSCARRESSTHAPQALELLNGPTSNHCADAFARRLLAEAGPDNGKMIDLAFRLLVGRAPVESEQRLALEFLGAGPVSEGPVGQDTASGGTAREQRVREFALAMFNLNESLYVP